jgi:protein ImuA
VISIGLAAIDRHLPEGGLQRGALHEVASNGPETEHGAAAALFIAGRLARLRGPVLWVLERPDLFAPGLAGAGLAPARVIYAEAGRPDTVFSVMEEGLRHAGLAAVVGEIDGPLRLAASRRLQLAAEGSGVMGFALRRGRRQGTASVEPSSAVTRWRLSALPTPPPVADAPHVPGLGPARWRLELIRCRGGEPASWIVEVCGAKGRLRLVAAPAEHRSEQAA